MSLENELRELADKIEIKRLAAESRLRAAQAVVLGRLSLWWRPALVGFAAGYALAAWGPW